MYLFIDIFLSLITCLIICGIYPIATSIEHFYIPIFLFVGLFILSIILTFVFIFLITLPIKKKGDFNDKPSKFYTFMLEQGLIYLMQLSRVKIHFDEIDLIPKDKRFVMVMNHRSKYDPMVINASLCGYGIVWVAKRSLINMPLIGRYLYKSCFLPIDRDDLKQSLKVIKQASFYIDNNLCSIGIYPEGTRNTTNDDLLPIKAGSMKIALLTKAPIVVVSCLNTEKVVKNWPFRTTHVYIKVERVIEYDQYKDLSSIELAQEVETELRKGIYDIKEKYMKGVK